jgi:glyoxylase-like metal-dependent hydrolase (beta-lactamase superfamily II)
MTRPRVTFLLSFVLYLLVQPQAAGQQQDWRLSEAAPDLHVITGLGGNVAFLVTEEGVLVVDSGTFPRHGKLILEQVRKKTDKPVRYLVLTHYHGDHVNGVPPFRDKCAVLAHRGLAENLERFQADNLKKAIEERYPAFIQGLDEQIQDSEPGPERGKLQEQRRRVMADLQEMKAIQPFGPDLTYRTELTLRLGGQTVRLWHPGPAHTGGDTIVHFVEKKAVHMGDMLFHRLHPFIDFDAGCDTLNWIAALKKVAAWDIEVVIPGHGEVTGKKGLDWKVEYLTQLRKEVGQALKSGKTLEQAQESVKMPAYKAIGFERILPRGVAAVYRELKGESRTGRKP